MFVRNIHKKQDGGGGGIYDAHSSAAVADPFAASVRVVSPPKTTKRKTAAFEDTPPGRGKQPASQFIHHQQRLCSLY